jgi:hypothetical protein
MPSFSLNSWRNPLYTGVRLLNNEAQPLCDLSGMGLALLPAYPCMHRQFPLGLKRDKSLHRFYEVSDFIG